MKSITQVDIQDRILVASANSALASGSLISGDSYNIANGQLGIVSLDHNGSVAYNSFVTGAATKASARKIQIVQGTPWSSETFGLQANNFMKPRIHRSFDLDSQFSFAYTAQVYRGFTNHSYIVTGLEVDSLKDYAVNIAFHGGRALKNFGTGGDSYPIVHTSADYASLSLSDDTDHLYHDIAYAVNRVSYQSNTVRHSRMARGLHVAFAIDIDGASGGTALAAATQGASIPWMVINGATVNYVVSEGAAAAFAALDADATYGSATIKLINPLTAGAAAGADALFVIAERPSLAMANDEIKSTTSDMQIGVQAPLGTPVVTEITRPDNGDGRGRFWQLRWEANEKLNVYSQQSKEWGRKHISPPSFIDEAASYNAFVIENYAGHELPGSHAVKNTRRTVILIPQDGAGTSLSPLTVAALNTTLQPWLESADLVVEELNTGSSDFFV